jgi:hypothetical protein
MTSDLIASMAFAALTRDRTLAAHVKYPLGRPRISPSVRNAFIRFGDADRRLLDPPGATLGRRSQWGGWRPQGGD